jgi:hypothetical protein
MGFRLFLLLFSLGNGLFATLLYVLTRPSLSTPLFEFPLLASLHALVLGTLLPLLLDRIYRDSSLFRVASLYVCMGELVLVSGFLTLPRSALPYDGGIMVTTGLLLAAFLLRPGSWRFLYWMALGGSAGLGILLGEVLSRPTIDPIPFSMIAAHGLLGAGLGLYPLFWVREDRSIRAKLPVITLVGAVLIFLTLVLKETLIRGSMGALFIGIVILAAIGLGKEGRLFGLLFVGTAAFLWFSGSFLPGEGISLLGLLLLGGCFVGLFRNPGGHEGEPAAS